MSRGFLSSLMIASLFGVLIVGCSENFDVGEVRLPANLLELERRYTDEVKIGKPMTIAQMSPEDAIVIVNGYPLTKRHFDHAMVVRARDIGKEKGMNPQMAEKRLEEFKMGFVKHFIAQRLMVDDALRQGVVTTNDVREFITEALVSQARRNKVPVERSLAALGAERETSLSEMAIAYTMNKLIKAKIPPKAKVDKVFVDAVKEQVASMNAEATKTNDTIRAKLAAWRQDILAGKADFATVAEKYSEDYVADDPQTKGGHWGKYEEPDMDDAKVAAAVFALKVNEISDVLEDFNGYQLVKVLSVVPAKRDKEGKLISREVRDLAHIYINKTPLIIEEGEAVMTRDLKYQMQIQAIDEYCAALMTNGTNKVVYPHGEILY